MCSCAVTSLTRIIIFCFSCISVLCLKAHTILFGFEGKHISSALNYVLGSLIPNSVEQMSSVVCAFVLHSIFNPSYSHSCYYKKFLCMGLILKFLGKKTEENLKKE
jgi:hypothetical protein